MKILIADDSKVSRLLLESALPEWGYQVEVAYDGITAWQALQGKDPPPLAILDWVMPGLDGPQLCQRIRATPRLKSTYLILLTVKDKSADIVAGLRSGADDYVSKSADLLELHARVQVGVRTVELHRALAAQAKELEEARARVDRFQGALPLCLSCKKVSDARGAWQSMEHYFARHMKLRFAHDICPECRRREPGERR